MNIIKRVINGLKSKSKYSDKILREYNDLRYDNSPSEIIINSLSEIIKANNCIFGGNHYTKNNLEDTDRLKEITDSKHNIWKNRQLFELAINEYFKTESIIVEYEKGGLHVYQSLLEYIKKDSPEYIKKDSPEYIVLKEKIDMCAYNNDILYFQFRPNLFDISL